MTHQEHSGALCDCVGVACRYDCPPEQLARCRGLDPTLPPAERAAATYQLRAALARAAATPQPVTIVQSSDPTEFRAELAAERRHAERHRCRHRAIESHRSEPCRCPVIALLPIYRCELLGAECADLRTPAAPALDCRRCPSREPG